jgi:hypothetical protein
MAAELKSTGAYIARTLSYKDAQFEVPAHGRCVLLYERRAFASHHWPVYVAMANKHPPLPSLKHAHTHACTLYFTFFSVFSSLCLSFLFPIGTDRW